MAWLIRNNWSIVDGGTLPIGQAVKSKNLMHIDIFYCLPEKKRKEVYYLC
jgi:hypothetical protein